MLHFVVPYVFILSPGTRYFLSEMSSHCPVCKMSWFVGSVLLSGSPRGHDCPVLGTAVPLLGS